MKKICFIMLFVFALVSVSFAQCDFDSIAGGFWHTIVLKSDGTVWTFGNNGDGQLGDGTITDRNTPVQVVGPDSIGYLTDIIAIAGGVYHTIALKSDGTAWTFGFNGDGQLGDGTITNRNTPVQVVEPDSVGYLTDIIAIVGGWYHTIALKSDGTVWTFGGNHYGQLGNGTIIFSSNTPVQVVGPGGIGYLTDIIAIASGWSHTIALKSDGTVWTFGFNGDGQLGDGTTTDRNIPVQVVGPGGVGYLTDIVAIAGGAYHTIALKSDGTVWTFGDNGNGQLGDGTTTNRNIPVQVVGPGGVGYLTDIVAIAGGAYHTIALKSDGTVWTFGNNDVGQLGDGTTTDRHTPVRVFCSGIHEGEFLPANISIDVSPNPFNSSCNIEFEISERCDVKANIYDIQGRMIMKKDFSGLQPGKYNIKWNAENLSSGIYFIRLNAGDQTITKRAILIK